jgi:hypothetical protein
LDIFFKRRGYALPNLELSEGDISILHVI